MVTQREEHQASFKDYCLILQVHPEADAGMIEAAYWHLARRYNDAASEDPTARAKLDDLNEAYSVLGSPERREQYLKIRSAVLGEGALPMPPPPKPGPVPLAVMERRRPKPREEDTLLEPVTVPVKRRRLPRLSFKRVGIPPWQNAVAALVMLVLAVAAFTQWAPWPLVVGLLLVGIAATTVPVMRRLPQLDFLRSPFSAETFRSPLRQAPAVSGPDADAVRESTADRVARLRQGGDASAAWTGPPTPPPSHEEPLDLPEEQHKVSRV